MGGRAGVTGLDGVEGSLVPTALVAVTVKVYVLPLANLSTVEVSVTPSSTAVTLPGSEVTVYWVIGLPPSETGAVQLTLASPSPATAVTPVGGLGGKGDN